MSAPAAATPSSSSCTSLRTCQPRSPSASTAIAISTVSPAVSPLSPQVAKIFESVPKASKGYDRLRHLCIEYGHRISGSSTLEVAIDWLKSTLESDGFTVQEQKCQVPQWVRGNCWGCIVTPTKPGAGFHSNTVQRTVSVDGHGSHGEHKDHHHTHPHTHSHSPYPHQPPAGSPMLLPGVRPLYPFAIGQSPSTPPDGVTASIVAVESYEELDALYAKDPNNVKGKIVFYNKKFTFYGDTVTYRTTGAQKAEKYGALATLVRSVGPQSLYTPHTGTSCYANIPGFCIPIEDADVIQHLYNTHDKNVVIHLYSSACNKPSVTSRNLIVDLVGSELPNEIVLLAAHMDSWDCGQGAMDDGQGCIVIMEALRVLRELGIKPRRTIRVVLYTDEENRSSGARAYRDKVCNVDKNIENHVAAIETDVGCYKCIGLCVTGAPALQQEVAALSSLLTPYNANTVVTSPHGGIDVQPLIDKGTPGLMLQLDWEFWDSEYFNYHHTNADTVDKIDPQWMIQNVQIMAAIAYILAQTEQKLGRGPVSNLPDEEEEDALEKFPQLIVQ